MAIAMGYYFRLPSDQRQTLEASIDKELTNKYKCRMSFVHTIKRVETTLYDNTSIPVGIARTDALLENLLCTVVCIDTKIPLIIVGPAGCSKTLSFSIAVDSIVGSQSILTSCKI